MDDFKALIPQLKEWDNGKGIDIDSWLTFIGRYEEAIAYVRLFWPEFIKHDGCIFRASTFDEDNYQEWLVSTKRNRVATQSVMNHVHIIDLFPNSSPPNILQLDHLGKTLQEIWKCKLTQEFPGLNIEVKYYEGSEEDPYGYELTFYMVE
jgi:hypothetical protein